MIVFRGTLSLEGLKILAREHLQYDTYEQGSLSQAPKHDHEEEIQKMEVQPSIQTNTLYSIIQMADGNYVGETIKNGKQIRVRQGDPMTTLQMLITHP